MNEQTINFQKRCQKVRKIANICRSYSQQEKEKYSNKDIENRQKQCTKGSRQQKLTKPQY